MSSTLTLIRAKTRLFRCIEENPEKPTCMHELFEVKRERFAKFEVSGNLLTLRLHRLEKGVKLSMYTINVFDFTTRSKTARFSWELIGWPACLYAFITDGGKAKHLATRVRRRRVMDWLGGMRGIHRSVEILHRHGHRNKRMGYMAQGHKSSVLLALSGYWININNYWLW